jgi:hypothetical protein
VFNHLQSPNPYADEAEHRLLRAATNPAAVGTPAAGVGADAGCVTSDDAARAGIVGAM